MMYSFLCGCAKFQPLSASHWGETNQNWLKSNTQKTNTKNLIRSIYFNLFLIVLLKFKSLFFTTLKSHTNHMRSRCLGFLWYHFMKLFTRVLHRNTSWQKTVVYLLLIHENSIKQILDSYIQVLVFGYKLQTWSVTQKLEMIALFFGGREGWFSSHLLHFRGSGKVECSR